VSGEEMPPQPPDDDTQQDFSEPLDPADAVVGGAEPPEQEEEEPEPEPKPQRQALPAETPSTSNNALIMQIKILSEYAKGISSAV
jgi:hypothetical protein